MAETCMICIYASAYASSDALTWHCCALRRLLLTQIRCFVATDIEKRLHTVLQMSTNPKDQVRCQPFLWACRLFRDAQQHAPKTVANLEDWKPANTSKHYLATTPKQQQAVDPVALTCQSYTCAVRGMHSSREKEDLWRSTRYLSKY